MSARARTPRGVIAGLIGVIAFSALAGLLVTVGLTPGLAVATVATKNATDVFENLPEYIAETAAPQQNRIWAVSGENDDGTPKYKQIATVYFQNRVAITEDQVTDTVKNALLAAEDVRFYSHGAIDPQGILRALINNAGSGNLQGASTLTQQLVKNMCITEKVTEYPDASQEDEKNKAIEEDCQKTSLDRKLKEMKSAIGLEKSLSKDQILLDYLNIAGFGGTVYGIQSAAQRYYDTDADKLTIAQAASLIAIVQEPGARSLDNPDHYAANKQRRDVIIKNMAAYNMISAADEETALQTPVDDSTVKLQDPNNGCIVANSYARQFCDYVTRSVKDFTSLGSTAEERLNNWKLGGYDVYTTLDLRLNKKAQTTLRDWAPIKETQLQLGASLISIEPGTGRILAMAQNKVFDNRDKADGGGRAGTSAINFNTDFAYGGSSGFQPGSSYKLFTLLNWLEQGHGLNEVVNVTPVSTPQSDFTDSCNGPYPSNQFYKPRNDSGETGYYSVRDATAQSINGGYVQMALQLDLCQTRQIAIDLGVHRAALSAKDNPATDKDESKDPTALSTNPASILGVDNIAPMTIAAAYATVAAGGTYCAPIAVDHFVKAGQTVPGQAQDCHPNVIDSDVTAAAASALQTGAKRYPGNPNDGTPLIAKTGTTNDSQQTWLTMGSTNLMTTVWYGNITGDFPIRSYYKTGDAGQQRHDIMKAYLTTADKIYGGDDFPDAPERLLKGVNVSIGDYTGMTEDAAKSAIQQLGMVYDNEGEIAGATPAGTIAKQKPAAGTALSKGQKVQVWISDGTKGTVPDVTTNPTDQATATAAINAAGFPTVNATCVATQVQHIDPGTGQPDNAALPTEGRVIAQDPSPGTALTKTKPVSISVAHEHC